MDPGWRHAPEGGRMADIAYVLGLIGFFALCALYVAALDRI
jgi:hypothetical protein